LSSILFTFETGSCNVESANADDCFIIEGALTLYLDGASNSSAAEESARESIISAMDNDTLLDSNDMPEVIKVQYLGETYNNYISGLPMTSIVCPNTPLHVTGNIEEVLVTYVYKVETANTSSSSTFLPMLEEKLLMQLSELCGTAESNTPVGIMSTPVDVEITIGKHEMPEDKFLCKWLDFFSVQGVSSLSRKQDHCTIKSSSADNCFVVNGALTLKVHSSSNSTTAEELVRDSIISAMDNDDLLDATNMPDVIKVQYLNKTFSDYIRGNIITSVSCDSLNASVPFIFTTDSASQVQVTYVYEVETTNTSSTASFLPVLEKYILMELSDMCEMLKMYGVLAIESAPDDVEMKTGTFHTIERNVCPI